jgi:hypothetical protein
MPDPNLDYAAIHQNVEKKLARLKRNYRIGFFIAHLLFFMVSALLVLRTLQASPELREVLIYNNSSHSVIIFAPALMWGMVLLFHAATLYFETNAGEKAIREQLLMREIGDDILRLGQRESLEKPKRRVAESTAMRLSDDGELVSADDQHLDQTDYNAHTHRASTI